VTEVGYAPGSWEPGYGVVTEAGFLKPAFCAFAVRRGWGRNLC
jgi:hypothetical protein